LIGCLDTGSSLRLVDGIAGIDEETGMLLLPGVGGISSSRRSSTNMAETISQNSLLNNENVSDWNETSKEEAINENFDYYDHDNDGDGFVPVNDDHDASNHTAHAAKAVTFAATVNEISQSKQVAMQHPDPWKLLDPHEIDPHRRPRPLKIGNTLRLPPGISDLPSDCVTGARTKKIRRPSDRNVNQDNEYEETTACSYALEMYRILITAENPSESDGSRETSNHDFGLFPSSIPLRGLVYGKEFEYLARANTKRRLAERRERNKQQRQAEKVHPSKTQEQSVEVTLDYDDTDDFGPQNGFDEDDDDDDEAFVTSDEKNEGPPVGRENNTGITSIATAFALRDTGSSENNGTFLLRIAA
jgi:hypothetical protein